jgi:hypothetical protein
MGAAEWSSTCAGSSFTSKYWGKDLSGTNPLADLASLSEMKKKSFILPTVG